MSSTVQGPYLIFSRAVHILTSAGVCDRCLIFSLSMTTVVTLCQSTVPIADSCPITDILDFNCTNITSIQSRSKNRWQLSNPNTKWTSQLVLPRCHTMKLFHGKNMEKQAISYNHNIFK